jgi:signal transduction histidine kinase
VTGLGLFLVKKMTELHQGKLEIFSIYGKGTTAKVVFPKARVIIIKGEADDSK